MHNQIRRWLRARPAPGTDRPRAELMPNGVFIVAGAPAAIAFCLIHDGLGAAHPERAPDAREETLPPFALDLLPLRSHAPEPEPRVAADPDVRTMTVR